MWCNRDRIVTVCFSSVKCWQDVGIDSCIALFLSESLLRLTLLTSLYANKYFFLLTYLLTSLLWCLQLYTAAPARITEGPRSIKVVENSVLSLVCRASGNPVPEISWSRGGRRIQPASAKRYTIIDIPGGSVLRIRPVKARRDDGFVDCVADNGVSQPASSGANIHVYTQNNGQSNLLIYLFVII